MKMYIEYKMMNGLIEAKSVSNDHTNQIGGEDESIVDDDYETAEEFSLDEDSE